MQIGFLNEHAEPIVPSVVRLLDECKRKEIPYVFTKFRNEVGSPFDNLIGWPNVRERPETDLHEAFIERSTILIEKNFYTAFTDEFERLVKNNSWETLLICGISTESCVLKTAVDAFERELHPLVIADACASDLGHEMHRKGLDVLEVLIGKNQIVRIDQLFTTLDK